MHRLLMTNDVIRWNNNEYIVVDVKATDEPNILQKTQVLLFDDIDSKINPQCLNIGHPTLMHEGVNLKDLTFIEHLKKLPLQVAELRKYLIKNGW